MRPETWNPPIDLSPKEEKIVKLIKRAKLFTFLREIRHLLFDEEFQEELSKMYTEGCQGTSSCATSPASLNLNFTLIEFLALIGSQSDSRTKNNTCRLSSK